MSPTVQFNPRRSRSINQINQTPTWVLACHMLTWTPFLNLLCIEVMRPMFVVPHPIAMMHQILLLCVEGVMLVSNAIFSLWRTSAPVSDNSENGFNERGLQCRNWRLGNPSRIPWGRTYCASRPHCVPSRDSKTHYNWSQPVAERNALKWHGWVQSLEGYYLVISWRHSPYQFHDGIDIC